MDETALAKAQERAVRAKALLDDELLQEGFQKLRQEYLASWQNTNVQDTEQRERLWQAHRIVGLIEKHLKLIITNGNFSTKELAAVKYLKR